MIASSKHSRSQAIQEYLEQIKSLSRDKVIKLTLSEGETVAMVSRRLGAAVKGTGKSCRSGEWVPTSIFGRSLPVREVGVHAKPPPPDGQPQLICLKLSVANHSDIGLSETRRIEGGRLER